ncbi:hypothetical protein OBBRIDRAFT_796615 [Obba rivulosa]|uniref:Uncharacterized protein n=1 Tax=Obba rivulosa TaxID=1052685 RepID=A0A8E2AUM5_9APHY|nr:hypothetical protein OBBRIDRAFT_796615 [Obba rivulosa]
MEPMHGLIYLVSPVFHLVSISYTSRAHLTPVRTSATSHAYLTPRGCLIHLVHISILHDDPAG